MFDKESGVKSEMGFRGSSMSRAKSIALANALNPSLVTLQRFFRCEQHYYKLQKKSQWV